MAYNQQLALRVRQKMEEMMPFTEKKMFGGVGFMVKGNMACGVNGDSLIVRVGPEHHEDALDRPHTRPFDMTGKPMAGWIFVDPAGLATDEDLSRWVGAGLEYALSLPPK